MALRIEELDATDTPIGVISLRRRYELANLGLARVADTDRDLHVLVGGLGLGYTLRAALQDGRVRQVQVIEAVEAVIEWHRRDLLPDTVGLAANPRCALVHGDFFALVASGETPRPSYDVVLLDVDHSPRNLLHPSHGAFYTAEGLARLATVLAPAGVFGLWSDDPPDADFEAVLDEVFEQSTTHVVSFANPLTGGESASTVYIANL